MRVGVLKGGATLVAVLRDEVISHENLTHWAGIPKDWHKMSRQHSTPTLVTGGAAYRLQQVNANFDESWLQDFIFKHHQTLPLDEIEPAFGSLIPVCRELPTPAGPVDLLFINNRGLLTLVECKLWRNPEARREVVGQILDYAKELSRWTYTDLQHAISRAQHVADNSLFELVARNSEESDERNFIDSVARNLRRGRLLLLIVGDGIRESVEQITGFLQDHAHLNFAFALVEFTTFTGPEQYAGCVFVQPRVIAQTVEVERAVVRIEDGQIAVVSATHDKTATAPRRKKISEQIFFEKVDADTQSKADLQALLEKARQMELYVEPGHDSLKVKSNLNDVNFGVFTLKGEFYNCGIASWAEEVGRPEIGDAYLEHLAVLFEGGFVYRSKSRFWWSVKVGQGRNVSLVTLPEILKISDGWLRLIQRTLDKIAEYGE